MLPLLLCGTYMICCNGILLSLISYLPWLCVVLAEAFKGIAKRALTANKWSRRAIKLETCSSRRTFSVCSWCKQDNKDATETSKYHQLILKTIFFTYAWQRRTYCQNAELVPLKIVNLVPIVVPITVPSFGVWLNCHWLHCQTLKLKG